ncbi:MAG: hypothetical protein COZ46_00715 [Verrucomicrobia bacterium CG_4_10_14_3_um_filter_43_23]|nr:MAG: hypothetical protein AUJ82_02115 [Verrucomicrobia bacterium CG1_02_43_26]PIP59744.1 MAG: hypothetical protein COX01_02245 [Verrucomicrobia bacterium CG22_combo_CG10-13_8_21_14_all_43_17]PIX59058.1 MAG: hypothetical protein COZ46_00715 [Verrucomicrobia bacterium CG_4_10_14_3_um_filter_43_23]PIY62547.1 MAG: hypothetical protein COY94_01955 [Verrucomicrobia bacterium CG_4_10_14_0_8_um_filter_43_34]PJA44633.1 MAG: hypothetical protein CO175_01670 [Verrucomicrobia bacterium CG_4_9_14_3_um_fi
MLNLVIAIVCTISISAFCSLLEAITLSASAADIEDLKRTNPVRGKKMYHYKKDIEETSSAILALNTIANTLGAVLVGGLATQIFGDDSLLYFSIGMSLGILLFSEIIPKNIGVIYRHGLLDFAVPAIRLVRLVMLPISRACKLAVRLLVPGKNIMHTSDKEIILLADKSTLEGTMSPTERALITNALGLDNRVISEIMTPRTVVTALEDCMSLEDVLREYPNIPFARMPVYEEDIDNAIGIIRRRDILKAHSEKKTQVQVKSLMHKALFLPETGTLAAALKEFLKAHQQIAIIVDEFGSFAGVLTIEDVMENILGEEIFEKDDVAVNMREFARHKKKLEDKSGQN